MEIMMDPARRDRLMGRFFGSLTNALFLPINEPGRMKSMHDAWKDYCELTGDEHRLDSKSFMRRVQDKKLELDRRSAAKISNTTFDVKVFAREEFHVM
jgi:polyhydroxyalkanoate synthesis regulator phasin